MRLTEQEWKKKESEKDYEKNATKDLKIPKDYFSKYQWKQCCKCGDFVRGEPMWQVPSGPRWPKRTYRRGYSRREDQNFKVNGLRILQKYACKDCCPCPASAFKATCDRKLGVRR